MATLPTVGVPEFRPDGSVLAVGHELWDISRPTNSRRIGALSAETIQLGVFSVLFSQDGKTLFTRNRYETFVHGVEDPTAPTLLTSWGSSHSSSGLALSADGRSVSYGTSDLLGRSGTFCVKDVSVPAAPRLVTCGGIQVMSPVRHTSMSADGNLIAASLNDHVAVLALSHIDPGTEESGPGPATQLSLIPKLRQATFSPRGRLLAAAHDDGGWAILNAQDPTDPRTVFRNTTVRDVADFVFSEDGGRLAFMGTDRATGSRTAQVWDLSRPERPRLLHQVPSSDGNTLDLDPTGGFLAESGDGRTTLWRLP